MNIVTADFSESRLVYGSYPVDCLDSAEYSLYPLKRFFIR